MEEKTIKSLAEMVYSITFKDGAGKEKRYRFWFSHFGDNYWNTNWSVYIENEENGNEWEYHELASWILRNEFNAAHPYEWIILFTQRRWQNSADYVVTKRKESEDENI